ncbi:unnamed protein product [Brassica napus]|uniref:(rape) hypothetical protein n=1 Tax=Brassica napus TaxID=3708 RepID=A0A816WGP9_BRANA|nr:unnamed protein product [Brassica napus]
MLNLLSSRYSTRLKASLLSRRHSFASSSSSTTSSASSSSRKYVSSSLSGDILDRYSWSLSGSAKASSSPLKGLLLDLSDAVPDITRRFRRFHGLKPEQVLELLLGFESELQRCGKVRPLWNIFRWASKQHKGFKHHSQVYEIMASLLIREGMVKEAELLLLEMEKDGETLDNEVVFCDLIQKYVDGFDSRKAVMLFDWMRGKGLVPLSSCYETLIDHLVRVCKTESAYRVCLDWVEARDESYNMNKIGKVIELLCLDHRVQEARDLARKLSNQTSSIYSRICLGYNEKQDFEDLLSFIREVKYKPDVFVGNRIVHSLCRKFGSERAYVYTEELQRLGFKPDEATYGILIGWCCHEGDLKRAFLYLSEIASKGLKPDVYSYNAVLSGLFRKGLWEHTGCVLEEMKENGVLLGLSTVKVMVAGYCKARRFEEAKKIVKEASKVEDPLTKVGFDPLAVRLKRDNGSGLSKAEFFDELGNGLYLDTDLDAYEEKVNMVLDRSVLPEFNLLIVGACEDGDLHRALSLLDEMPRWGQKLSRRGFTVLMKSLCVSRSYVRVSVSLMRKWPKLANQLDGETLNFLVQEYCKKGLSRQSKLIFHRMSHQTHLHIDNFLVYGYYSCGDYLNSLRYLSAMISEGMRPNKRSLRVVISSLCESGDVKKAMELWEVMESKGWSFGSSVVQTKIAESLISRGDMAKAEDFLTCVTRNGLMAPYYDNVIKKLTGLGSLSVAVHLLNIMLKNRKIPDSSSYDSVINGLLRCSSNKLDEARDFHAEMLELGLSPSVSTWSGLVHKYIEACQVMEAERLIKSMVELGGTPSQEMFKVVIDRFRVENNTVKASEMVEMMQKCGYEVDFETHWSLISNMSSCKEKKTEAGQGFLSRLLSGNGFSWKR